MVNLGDAGRSPRMTNHIEQICTRKGAEVDYLTFVETENPQALNHRGVRVYALNHSLLYLTRALPFFFYFWLRMFIEVVTLQAVFLLRLRKRYNYILVQNPYALPALWLLVFYRLFCRDCKIVVDVHNFGYTLLGPSATARKPTLDTKEPKSAENGFELSDLLRIARECVATARRFLFPVLRLVYQLAETLLVRLVADEVLVVSKAMKEAVERDWGVAPERVKLLYDAPNAAVFKKLSLADKHEFFSLFRELRGSGEGSLFARLEGGKLVEHPDRPLVLTVSTSWSADDDFDTLIDAVELYKKASGSRRQLEFFFTGAGPKKARLAPRLKALADDLVKVHVKWFEGRDYAQVVGASDFTVCVHRSSSGVDLPIKVLDSFACEVPVIAFNYAPTLHELLSDLNGYLFANAAELCEILKKVADAASPKPFSFNAASWSAEWKKVFN